MTQATQSPLLNDTDQPFSYDIRLFNRLYRLEFYDTSSPTSYNLLKPDVILLCWDIGDRCSLMNAQHVWKKEITQHYQNDEMPVMLLGLKRDLRVEEEGVIHPQEVSRTPYLQFKLRITIQCTDITRRDIE